MLHELPITDIRLSACHENWHHMTPTERGRHCASCNREVVDFTQATAADLARARAAAPDGRLCGRFRASQLAPESRSKLHLRPKLRQFLVALVLVVLQGFSAQQAWAQVQPQKHVCTPLPPGVVGMAESSIVTAPATYKHGTPKDFEREVNARLQWPLNERKQPVKTLAQTRKRVRVFCTVDTMGHVHALYLMTNPQITPKRQEAYLVEVQKALDQFDRPFEPAWHYDRVTPMSIKLRLTFQRPRS